MPNSKSSSGKASAQPKYLYHYTTKTSAAQIASSGYIKGSTRPGDAVLGTGGYFTSKPPQTSTQNLLRNNYDGAASQHRPSATNAYVRIPANKVSAVDGRSQLNRDVFLVPGKRVVLPPGTKIATRSGR